MKKVMKSLFNFLFLAILFCSFVSCDPKVEQVEPLRLFKPVYKAASPVYNNLTIEWAGSNGAIGYEGQVSRTPTFEKVEQQFKQMEGQYTIIVDPITKIQKMTYTFLGLEDNAFYTVRIRSLYSDSTLNSKWQVRTILTGPLAHSIISFIQTENIGSDYIDVPFTFNPDSTEIPQKLVLINVADSTQIKEFTISSEELAAKKARATGLSEMTNYKVIIRSANKVLGSTKAKTSMSIPSGAIDVDAEMASGKVFQQIVNEAPDGATLLFKSRNAYYETGQNGTFATNSQRVNNCYVNKALTFMGEPGKPRPVVHIHEMNLGQGKKPDGTAYRLSKKDTVTISNLKFYGLDITGTEFIGGVEQVYSTNMAMRLLDINRSEVGSAHLKFGEISFENCIIRNYTYGIYYGNAQETNRYEEGNTFRIENCIVYDISRKHTGAPSLAYVADAWNQKLVIHNFNFLNSTFVGLALSLVVATNNITDTDPTFNNQIYSFNISNCTFDEFGTYPRGSSVWYGSEDGVPIYANIIDFNYFTTPQRVNINKTIIGKIAAGYALPPRQALFNGETSYRLSDCSIDFSTRTYALPSTAVFNKTNWDYIKDNHPNFNLKVVDPTLASMGLGDPRWQ